MKQRRIAAGLLLLMLLGFSQPTAYALSYAGVMLGVASPTGLTVHQDMEAERVTPGSFGTTLLMDGLFPLSGRFSFSPSFGFISTNGSIKDHPVPPTDFNIRFHQSELACDLLWQPGGLHKFRVGPGVSAAWWTAVEDKDINPYRYEYESDIHVVKGQSALLRGVAYFMLRNPEVSGVSAKLVVAQPMTDLLKLKNTAATGYISLHIGFSMVLN